MLRRDNTASPIPRSCLTDYDYKAELERSYGLHDVALRGTPNECRQILETDDVDVNVNQQDVRHNTALHLASDPDIVKVLLDNGADVNIKNFRGTTALHEAAYEGHVDKMRLLLEAGASPTEKEGTDGRTPLHEAADRGYLPGITDGALLLLEYGANLDDETNKLKRTALHMAAYRNNITMVQKLLEKGASVNSRDVRQFTPLHTAVLSAFRESVPHDLWTVKLLLDHGAIIDALPVNETGATLLHRMVDIIGGYEVVRLLLEWGAEVDVCNYYEQTPLILCAASTWTDRDINDATNAERELCEHLLTKGASIDWRDIYGCSALHYAANIGNRESVKLLTSKNANPRLKDRFGTTPVHMSTANDTTLDIIATVMGQERGDKRRRGRKRGDRKRGGRQGKEEAVVAMGMLGDTDKFGSTPLHWAAWYGNVSAVTLLLERGAPKDAVDSGGCTAGDIAWLRGYQQIAELLEASSLGEHHDWPGKKHVLITTGLYKWQPVDEGVLVWLPFDIPTQCVSKFDDVMDVLKTMSGPTKKKYLLSALHRPGLGMLPDWKEVDEICAAVDEFVRRILKKVGELDERFASTVVPSGSMHEGTKCGAPDEFDFICCLNQLSDCCETKVAEAGFRLLHRKTKHTASTEAEPYSEFFESNPDGDARLKAEKLVKVFCALVRKAVWCPDTLWIANCQLTATEHKTDRHKTFLKLGQVKGPSTVVKVEWRGQRFKALTISIDIVPALQLNSWPDEALKCTRLLPGIDLQANTCYMVIKKPSSCVENFNFVRLSFSVLEGAILRDMPAVHRKAFILAKTIRDISVDVYDHTIQGLHDEVDIVSTYMLKTAFFKVMERVTGEPSKEDTLRIASDVYRELGKCLVDERHVPSYFVPQFSLLEEREALKPNTLVNIVNTVFFNVDF